MNHRVREAGGRKAEPSEGLIDSQSVRTAGTVLAATRGFDAGNKVKGRKDDRWQHSVEDAVDVTLAGRFYKRFADHAVSVAKRVVYLVTGAYIDDLPAQ